jgi:LPXTG-motif cell wall-anchored protein
VVWTSPTLWGDGSTVLHYSVSAAGPSAVTGSLDDTAALTGAGGFTASSPLNIPVTTSALFALTVNASIPAAQSADQSFDVSIGDGSTTTPETITVAAGDTTGSVTLTDLAAGTYTVHEAAPTGWDAQPDQHVSAAAPTCAYSVTFANAKTVVATPTPTASLIPATSTSNTPHGEVQGVVVTTPNTGSDLPFGASAALILLGGGMVGWGRRRNRKPTIG